MNEENGIAEGRGGDCVLDDSVTADQKKSEDDLIVRSPWANIACHIQVPNISAPEYLLGALSLNHDVLKHQAWVVDAIRGKSVLFSELEPLSYKFASALTKMGFQKGDWLYFVTYEVALIYVVQFGVWRCGGTVRGCFQKEMEGEFMIQLLETKARFVLCDRETAAQVKRAVSRLPWNVQLLSIGDIVTDAISVEDMMYKDDGNDFPQNVKIHPIEDVIAVPNTSGSSGTPKGAMHTHSNIITFLENMGGPKKLEKSNSRETLLTLMGNFSVGAFMHICMAIVFGYSVISISKFNKRTFLAYVDKYKPSSITLYHYVASWLVRSDQLKKYDLSFLKYFISGGSVSDYSTISKLAALLPSVKVVQSYGLSETLVVTTSNLEFIQDGINEKCDTIAGLKFIEVENDKNPGIHLSCGVLFPQVEAKIVDPDTGHSLDRMCSGKVFLKCPFVMKGYMDSNNEEGYTSEVDEDGWFDTKDIGFFDDAGHLYVVDRFNHIFKYFMHQVSPIEIESIIGEHPDVLSAGVVAIPNPETTSVARAYIVLKPGKFLTEDEIITFVSGKTVFYKHLHGGAAFVHNLPMNQGGKLDRKALLRMAMRDIKP